MEDNRQFFECQECGAEGSAATDMDLVVEFCPFCGLQIESEELPEEFLDIDFTDHAQLGRGVDLVDGEEED